MPKKSEHVTFINYGRKIKPSFIIYAQSENILVPENNGRQNPDKRYRKKYLIHVTCSYNYKLVCADDKFSKPFKSNLDEDAVYNFINSMIKESKSCTDITKKNFNK